MLKIKVIGVIKLFCLFQGKIVNTVAHTGLVDAHAYSVTAVTEVNCKNSHVHNDN